MEEKEIKMNTILKNELNKAKAIIDVELLKDFIAANCNEIIGVRRDGTETLLLEELKTLGSWYAKIQALYITNYIKRNSFRMAEYTEEEKHEIAKHTYEMSARKILWLNSVCHSMTNEYFVKIKIDKSNSVDMEDLVEAYNFAIIHPDLF